ncbi:DNA-deoxyinosine glycosylase [Paenibacillus nasutitermitis]|uniref:DNA-deoxyinosine glycosylase n=1 Tax=Paenibacillus nasutitermitis TaxID=1652958 RepID=A0A917E1S2_9BACL|nr:DNA-deoxyinosine glycosylase [Paenibacillus nasutitermitis]GGD95748.1 DNA-deoxyinosine glycosylase [Paenibacillus nasutitermitis]
MPVQSFPPLIDGQSTLLVLGSMPGTASLAKHQYYGHPRNHFWPVLYALAGAGVPAADYLQRLAFARERGVALWDVIAACEREGSLDANIREAVPNDLPALLAGYPAVRALAFNGNKAYDTFKKYFSGHPMNERVAHLRLPSTSPIPTARMRTTADRVEAWRPILDYMRKP